MLTHASSTLSYAEGIKLGMHQLGNPETALMFKSTWQIADANTNIFLWLFILFLPSFIPPFVPGKQRILY